MRLAQRSLTLVVVLCALAMIHLGTPSAFAQDRTNQSPGTLRVPSEYPNISAAAAAAASGDTILLASGTFAGPGNTDVVFEISPIVFTSEYGPDSTIIDCEGGYKAFYCTDADIVGVTITNAGENGIYSFGDIRLQDCVFTDNGGGTESFGGGAIRCEGNGILANCRFVLNSSSYGAGAVAIFLSADVTDCLFEMNHAGQGSGGAISCGAGSVIRTSTFTDNYAYWGGAVSGPCDSIIDCTFTGNTNPALSDFRGGAIAVWGTVVLRCTFIGNSGFFGAAAYATNCSFVSCLFSQNSGYLNGFTGSMLEIPDNAIVSLENCLIVDNGGEVVRCGTGASAQLICSNVYGNADGDWVGCIAGQLGVDGNISADPGFCDATIGDFHLRSTSPCLKAACGIMGPFGQGCWDEIPAIMRVKDVGNDQGRQARVTWLRSLYDAPGDSVDLTGYAVYRRRDQYVAGVEPLPRTHGNVHAPQILGRDYIDTVPARGDSAYEFVAPTLCDSTVGAGMCWSTFFVSAMTSDPFVYYDSDPDSGYSLDNLPPPPPANLSAAYNTGSGNHLTWDPSYSPDMDHYRVYRGIVPDFPPTPTTLVGTTTSTQWTDPQYDGWPVHYKVCSVDQNGNQSSAASPDGAASDVQDRVPRELVLYQNVPNPFNPTTRIRFYLPTQSMVRIDIYDSGGRRVRALQQTVMTPGLHDVTWDGRDGRGARVSSGVYFCRLRAGGKTLTATMTLVK